MCKSDDMRHDERARIMSERDALAAHISLLMSEGVESDCTGDEHPLVGVHHAS
ncbi:hypothetical protein WH158_13530 [Gluconobacter cerinus]